jgi:predicted DNA-binding WGR domain protein
MAIDNILGRYECTLANHNKFWHVYRDLDGTTYVTEWGKIGAQAQGRKAGLDEVEVERKVREKIGKGYVFKGGFKGTVHGQRAAIVDEDSKTVRSTKKEHIHVGGRRKLDLD